MIWETKTHGTAACTPPQGVAGIRNALHGAAEQLHRAVVMSWAAKLPGVG